MKTLFIRNKNTIRNLETGKVEHYKSINLAKKASRKVTAKHGLLALVNMS